MDDDLLGPGAWSLEDEDESAHLRSLATEASDAKKVLEEVTTEDVFPNVYARDSTTHSPEGLEVELEGQPRAQFSSLPLPNPVCSAEQATKGRGYPQVTNPTDYPTVSAPANSDSSPCADECLAFASAGLQEN